MRRPVKESILDKIANKKIYHKTIVFEIEDALRKCSISAFLPALIKHNRVESIKALVGKGIIAIDENAMSKHIHPLIYAINHDKEYLTKWFLASGAIIPYIFGDIVNDIMMKGWIDVLRSVFDLHQPHIRPSVSYAINNDCDEEISLKMVRILVHNKVKVKSSDVSVAIDASKFQVAKFLIDCDFFSDSDHALFLDLFNQKELGALFLAQNQIYNLKMQPIPAIQSTGSFSDLTSSEIKNFQDDVDNIGTQDPIPAAKRMQESDDQMYTLNMEDNLEEFIDFQPLEDFKNFCYEWMSNASESSSGSEEGYITFTGKIINID